MVLLLALLAGCAAPDPPTDWGDVGRRDVAEARQKAMALMSRMTLEDKVGQVLLISNHKADPDDVRAYRLGGVISGGSGAPTHNTPQGWAAMIDAYQAEALATPLGIPIWYAADTVHGAGGVLGATVFPHAIGLGAAGDFDLSYAVARATAAESRAVGITWALHPAVSVPQDLRWGRVYESLSQDPAEVARLGAATVRGLQGRDLSAPDSVLATPKHFIADGATVWGTSIPYAIDQGDAQLDEATLRAVHLPPFEAAVASGAMAVMVSQSSYNGDRMHAHQALIEDVLRGELGFEGVVVSDWNGVNTLPGGPQARVAAAMDAGIDVLMLAGGWRSTRQALLDAVRDGDVSMHRLDEAVSRVVATKLLMGLFDAAYTDPDALSEVGSSEHAALAAKVVGRTLVLVQHDGDTLPLDPDAELVVVGGAAANNVGLQCGGWTVAWQGQTASVVPGTTVLDGIRDLVEPEGLVSWSPIGTFNGVADGQADIGIAVIGEMPYAEGFGDQPDLALSDSDRLVVQRVAQKSQRTVVVLITGRPRLLDDVLPYADAVVVAWLPGSQGAPVADVLFGVQRFSGRLPVDWPRDMSQVPAAELAGHACPPLYPLGHGLDAASPPSLPPPCP